MGEQRIWLIGGTQESAEIARELVQQQIPYVVSVTSESARNLYPNNPLGAIWVDRLTAASLPQFLQQHNIGAVLDASHPFAVEISQLAIATCTQWHIPYLRYERPGFKAEGRLRRERSVERGQRAEGEESWGMGHYARRLEHLRSRTQSSIPHSLTPNSQFLIPTPSLAFPNFDALLTSEILIGQRVLLTTGYRSLKLFKPWQERAVLFARILPSVTALEGAIAAGFTPDRIIALRPPITADLEQALWQQWQITMVVTKASGTAGGEDVKHQVAAELGVPLVIIARPEVAYPQQTSDLSVALKFCQELDAV